MPSTLRDVIRASSAPVLAEIQAFFSSKKQLAYDVGPHLVQSLELLEEFVLRGGKAMRPTLAVQSFQLFGGHDARVYAPAAALELFHKYILLVDDIADRDEVRNGGPTVWKHYANLYKNEPDHGHISRTLAEIDGVLLSSFTYEMIRISKISSEQKLQLIELVNNTIYWKTVAGWQLQFFQNMERIVESSEEIFLLGLELVTSQYSLVAPLRAGAILAGTPLDSPVLKALESYGHHIGIAFQLQDDILGMFGDPTVMGKPVGNDLREGKKTLLLQRAYAAASQDDQLFLDQVCGHSFDEPSLKRAQQIMISTGAKESCLQLANQAVDAGIRALDSIDQTRPQLQFLTELAHFSVERDH